jgi:hypothetical protein
VRGLVLDREIDCEWTSISAAGLVRSERGASWIGGVWMEVCNPIVLRGLIHDGKGCDVELFGGIDIHGVDSGSPQSFDLLFTLD